ncbi:hypothetical protein A3860_36730 [Niastella vici]|uniref:Secretion system C-terminal sorting domain-containing protein n=1 Tax=Niastella vici TaxID=1703345 RepID=A0A1V9FMU4_9BACT|nr:hypothetical protein [Niastella vici]OQP59627.1 hypothetical protein A3860_36730 [Niastella vici]
MIKKLHCTYIVCVWILLFVTRATTLAQTTLTAGDIVVLGMNTDDVYPDQRWAFMTLVNLAANTKINFTDAGYDGTAFRVATTNEGHMQWTAPGPVSKGTIIYGTNTKINGATTNVSGQLGGTAAYLSQGGDQIIVYQGTLGTATGATFIYALNTGQSASYTTDGSWQTTGSTLADYLSYLPPGLSSTTTATLTSSQLNTSHATGSGNFGFDNMYYAGTTTGTRAALLAAISNPANWVGSDGSTYNIASSGVFPSAFTILPVILLYFNVQSQAGETVQLTWGTAIESNNDHFTLERSDDGVHYSLLTTVPGKGDHDQPVDYSFIDHSPEAGNNYYRLSQTDRDGRVKILGIKSIQVQAIALRVGPNPAIQFVEADFTRGDWREIKLYNSAEQLLQTISLKATASQVKIPLQDYRPGSYYLAFVGTNGRTNTVRKILKR